MTEITWVFMSVHQNPFDKEHAPDDPKAHYEWELAPEGYDSSCMSGCYYTDIQLFMQHFGVNTPRLLAGKKFTVDRNDPSSALNLLLVKIRNGGEYTPPSLEEVRYRAALALANFSEPDFLDVDKETVFKAFSEVWDGFHANPNWLSGFMAEVNNLSRGHVKLVEGDKEEFPTKVRGPAEYLNLVKGGLKKLVILGPYSTPVSFLEKLN